MNRINIPSKIVIVVDNGLTTELPYPVYGTVSEISEYLTLCYRLNLSKVD